MGSPRRPRRPRYLVTWNTDQHIQPRARASDGCVVLTNQDLEAISKNLRVGVTPVIITENIEWAEPEETGALREQLLRSVEGWRHDWEGRDTEQYLKHYAPGF